MKKMILALIVYLPLIANAHTLWDFPAPRNTNDNVKEGPCGPQGVAANVKPNVANPNNVFAEGQTIDISWFETINHTGYFWVDLARTDADLLDYNPNDPDPANNNRATVWRLSPAPPANFPDNNNMSGFKFEQQVTLPAGVTCENCTMRLVQFMEGRAQPYYYSCADVRIISVAAAAEASRNLYATTVHPVQRTYCASCHDVGGAGQGAHSVADPGLAHNNTIQLGLINFVNPNLSQLVIFAGSSHQAGFTGPQTGTQMQTAVENWVNGAGKVISAVAPGDLPPPSNNGGGGGDNGTLDIGSSQPGSQTEFGGCGTINSNGSGPGGPWSALLFLLPLIAIYAGKISPIAFRR